MKTTNTPVDSWITDWRREIAYRAEDQTYIWAPWLREWVPLAETKEIESLFKTLTKTHEQR